LKSNIIKDVTFTIKSKYGKIEKWQHWKLKYGQIEVWHHWKLNYGKIKILQTSEMLGEGSRSVRKGIKAC